jgi:integrase
VAYGNAVTSFVTGPGGGGEELNSDKIHAYLGEDEKTIEDEAYTHEQVKRMLQFAQLRTRVLILLLASSGIRIGATADLRKKHLTYIEKYSDSLML